MTEPGRSGLTPGDLAAHRGEIPVIRVGRRMLVPTARLLAMLGLEQGEGAA